MNTGIFMGAALVTSLFVTLNTPCFAIKQADMPSSGANLPIQDHQHAAGEHEDHAPGIASDVHEAMLPHSPAHGETFHAEHAHENTRDDSAHGQMEAHEENAGAEVHLSEQQRRTLGIEIQRLAPRSIGESISSPGEIRINAYASAQVTSRIAAQVVERHAHMGDVVNKDQALLTLTSVEMAQAQGELLMADREWQRVRKLGRKVVSDKRYLAARIARQQARARVIAFGMQAFQVDELLRGRADAANGSFQLLAPREGTVIRDDFILGELIEPGRVLFEITDEHLRWVEARMPPEEASRIPVDAQARVRYREHWFEGRVIQIHHVLDETTRTQAIRIEVPDTEHRLHPGVFVEVSVSVGEGAAVLALPEAAVLRSTDGDWQVFVPGDEPGAFLARQVELVRTVDGLAVIKGLPPGTEVVSHGAFFLQSELAKAGFDVHQH